MQNFKLLPIKHHHLILFLSLLVVVCPDVRGQKGLAESKGPIVQSRERTRALVEYVHLGFDPSSDEYGKAMKLYSGVRAAYEGWIASVKTAIESGDLKEFKKSKAFKQQCEDAAKAGETFVDYVESLDKRKRDVTNQVGFKMLGTGKSKIATLSELLDAGGKAVQFVRSLIILIKDPEKEKKQLEIRRQQALNWESGLNWLRWNEIVAALKG